MIVGESMTGVAKSIRFLEEELDAASPATLIHTCESFQRYRVFFTCCYFSFERTYSYWMLVKIPLDTVLNFCKLIDCPCNRWYNYRLINIILSEDSCTWFHLPCLKYHADLCLYSTKKYLGIFLLSDMIILNKGKLFFEDIDWKGSWCI